MPVHQSRRQSQSEERERSFTMHIRLSSFTILLAAALLVSGVFIGSAAQAPSQGKGGQEEFGPYELVENWPQPLQDGPDGVKHAGWTWGSVGAVYAETPDRIWIAQRGELPLPPDAKPWTPYSMLTPPRVANGNDDGRNPTCNSEPKPRLERRYHHAILVVDRNGKLIQWWQDLDKIFDMPCGRGPHKIKMNPYDPSKHVWIIDDQLHMIYKFTYDGKLVMSLGTKGQKGRDGGKLFDRPTDIAWLPDGTFFISDGYGGTRVAKFDKDGKFLDMFKTGVRSSPYAHIITTDQFLWISDGGTNRIVKYDLDGHYMYGWGGPGGQPGQFNGPHSITVDQEGNLYLAEVFNGRVQKFRPKPNADKAKLVGQEQRYGAS